MSGGGVHQLSQQAATPATPVEAAAFRVMTCGISIQNHVSCRVNSADVAGSRRRLLASGNWDELPVGDKLQLILDSATRDLFALSSCTYLRPS